MAIGEALKEANRQHNARREARRKGENQKRNKAIASGWVGGENGSQLTAEELRDRMRALKDECIRRHPSWFFPQEPLT